MRYLLRKIFLFIVLITMSTGVVAQEAPEIFSHTVLKLPFDLKSDEPWSKIIRTQEEWEMFYIELLEENTVDTVIPSVLPQIDFETFQVVTGGIGFRPSSGYSVSVRQTIELSDTIYIGVLVVSPGKNCLSAAVVTYPSTTLLIKKTSKPIEFFSFQLIYECPL